MYVVLLMCVVFAVDGFAYFAGIQIHLCELRVGTISATHVFAPNYVSWLLPARGWHYRAG